MTTDRFTWQAGDVVFHPPSIELKSLGRFTFRDWAEWDAEHEGGGWKQSTSYWAEKPPSWVPNPGQDLSIQAPRVPTDDDLNNAASQWKGDPSEMRFMQTEIEAHTGVDPWNVGGPSKYEPVRAQTAAIMNQVAQGDPTTKTLWRGLALPPETVDGITKGGSIDLPLAGFSEKKSVATTTSWSTSGPTGQPAVLFKLQPGAKTYNLDGDTEHGGGGFVDEKEHITSGKFQVVDVQPTKVGPGSIKSATMVTLKQTDPLPYPKGGWR